MRVRWRVWTGEREACKREVEPAAVRSADPFRATSPLHSRDRTYTLGRRDGVTSKEAPVEVRLRAVIGIDAAWTRDRPSGVALCVERGGAWRCEAVAPSYADFFALGDRRRIWWGHPRADGGAPEPARLLRAAAALAPGARVMAVALDLPLALGPIAGRREADRAISREYGGRGCSTHTPSRARPGRISSAMRAGFEAAGFPLATVLAPHNGPAILEVYPHTALLSMLPDGYRIPYKASRSARYWPGVAGTVRRRRLLGQWRRILAALARRMEVILELPASFPSFSAMKPFEDAIDAMVCAWVAIEFLAGNATPSGDQAAAIWSPR